MFSFWGKRQTDNPGDAGDTGEPSGEEPDDDVEAGGEGESEDDQSPRRRPVKFGLKGFTGRFFRSPKKRGDAAAAGDDGDDEEPADEGAEAEDDQDWTENQGRLNQALQVTEMVRQEAADGSPTEAEVLCSIDRNILTGAVRRTVAQMEASRRGKYMEEDLGLMREPRPYIFPSVVNGMEQRLTRFSEVDRSNVVAAGDRSSPGAGEGKADPGRPLETISESQREDPGQDQTEEGEGGDRPAREPGPADKTAGGSPGGKGKRFLDENGIMISLPDPKKEYRERSHWTFDEDAEYLIHYTEVPRAEPVNALDKDPQFTLDVSVPHLELAADMLMAREEYLMAQLMSIMREFKRRESVGLADFYAAKLGALEESLLAAREDMFSAVEKYRDGEAPSEAEAEVTALLDNCARFELQVAETRQLKEEEEQKLAETAKTMEKLYRKVEAQRSQQGYRLTSQRLEMQMIPYDPHSITLQTQQPRDELDAVLLVAEEDAVAGMPEPPELFDDAQPLYGEFRLRRVESTCGAFMKIVRDLKERREALLGQGSVSEDSEEVRAVDSQLQELGLAPHRLKLPERDVKKRLKRARRKVREGEYGVKRLSRPSPVLLDEDVPEEESAALPPHELTRRQRVTRTGYYIKLLINGHLAGRSEVRYLREDFTIDFYYTFRVRLWRWPEVTVLQLWKKSAVRDVHLVDVPFTVPGSISGSSPEDPCPIQHAWSCLVPFNPNWPPEPLQDGSESPMKKIIPDTNIFASGSVWIKSRWVPADELEQLPKDNSPSAVTCYQNPLAEEAWEGFQEEARPRKPPTPKRGTVSDVVLQRGALNGVGRVSKTRLAEWLGRAGLDPNDPRNAWYVELLKTREAQAAAVGKAIDGYFRLEIADEIMLRPAGAFDSRKQFLLKRWDMGPGVMGMFQETKLTAKELWREEELDATQRSRPITSFPLDPNMLPSEANAYIDELMSFHAKEIRGVSADPVQRMFGVAGGRDTTTSKLLEREKAIEEFARTIKARMTTRMRAAERLHNPQTEDVVRDIVLPEQAAFDLSAIFAALAPIRRFGPPPKRSIPIVSHPKKVEVSVTVHHARNLPRRIAGGSYGGGGRLRRGGAGRRSRLLNDIAEEEDDFVDGGGDLDSEQINVFVQAWLQGKDKRTRSERSFGGSATWDEGFKLGLSLPHNPDYSAKALSECRDEIIISVFDEIALSGGQAAVSRRAEEGSTVTIHRIKRLLGTLRISINALHRMSQIDGTFPLEIPAMMAGYKPAERSLPTIKLSLCFMPRLEVPLFTPKEELRSSESDVIVRHAFDWLSELNAIKQCQRRFIKAMAVDASGRAALLCRYVGMAWELPPGYDNSEQSLPRLARLVAQVPFLQDNEMRTKRHDVWTTCAKFLELGVGDNEEHATLLSGYFTALNVKNFIVLGTSINFAEDIWVLTVQGVGAGRSDPSGQQLDTSKLLLWSPLSGRSYSVDSEICPLIEVGVLFDDANIWANIQIDGHPKNVNWDLTQPGSWKPFFGPVIEPVNIRTLQQEIRRDTHYRRENNLGKLFYEGLASRADKCVWNLIRKMRTKEERESTKQALRFGQGFLRNSLNNLQDKLEEFHEVIGNPDPEAQDAQASVSARLSEEHTNALRQELRGRNVIKDFKSHLFCLPMSDDFERQVEEVLGRHKFVNLPKNWEYAVACTVVPKGLPFTCSIWVYIAALKEN